MTEAPVKKHAFQAQVNEVLSLVINSLYSHKEVFLRELLSNASDALDKQRLASLTSDKEGAQGELRIRLLPNKEAGTLAIEDNGVGMNEQSLVENLGTVAHSGTRRFLEQLEHKQDSALIGQFGVGFYSAYLVAEKVEVISKPAGEDASATRWVSDAKENFTTEPAERDGRGTTVVLHLKDEHKEFLEPFRLRQLVQRYSDYISFPIELVGEAKEGADADDEAPKAERINQASALWQRPASDITDEQYEEFYKHLTHDFEGPLAHRHFKVEGTQLFTGLLFVPRRPPFDLFSPEQTHGVRLHVKRVFIMDDCEALLPKWLRFVRGVVDSEDLPLNVSRELLQDSRVVQTIRKQIIKHALDMLKEVAQERPEDYASLWKSFGPVIKEGLHFDPEFKDRLLPLLRYESSTREGLVSLDEYVEKMPEEQAAVYYALGPNRATVENSPHLESLRKKGFEVLYMTDPVDSWAVENLDAYKEKSFVSAMKAELTLDEEDDKAKDEDEAKKNELGELMTRFNKVLEEQVSEVRTSRRLVDSPACLVIPEGGLQPHIEQLLRLSQGVDMPKTKRILEINPDHSLVGHLKALHEKDAEHPLVTDLIRVLYDQALLAEGSPLDEPARLAGHVTRLAERVAAAEADA